ncbi:MAG: hypothetical protein ACTS73_07765 [Arsenophonus sp. NEOnobi-MAG3]
MVYAMKSLPYKYRQKQILAVIPLHKFIRNATRQLITTAAL